MKKKIANLGALSGFQRVVSIFIVVSFVFVALHASFHNSHDHKHESSCAVYVLEQLSFGGDLPAAPLAFFLFTPYFFLLFALTYTSKKLEKTFAIRAPPLF